LTKQSLPLKVPLSSKQSVVDVYLNLGNTYIAAGRLREATIALRTYTELQQYDPAGYYRLGFALFSLKEYKEAAATFEKLILIDKTAHNFYQTARCYAKLKNHDKLWKKLFWRLRQTL
jgi:tetratricopeptide (TPR) repeat protein